MKLVEDIPSGQTKFLTAIDGDFKVALGDEPLDPIKYVHQLQNLYFALTGEELIMNTSLMPVKYQKEIREALIEVFNSDWMLRDVDHDLAISMIFEDGSISYESLSNNIDVAIAHGHSLEFQLNFMKAFFKKILEG
ncbi:hypothetical protein [Mucilaginibacter sp. UYCu711]|uniref:hypothetical protein n=1 Tax=Mucilaginibacter sp. UYCu711 TaxID=3156339 RepID=UPI003D1BB751